MSSPSTDPAGVLREPLPLGRILVPRVWGGSRLAGLLGVEAPGGEPIGESWEVVDREDRNSEVVAGRFAGRSLGGLMLTDQEALLGRARPGERGGFPLLVKYLDTASPLSVQVHPDGKIAERLGGSVEGKEEAWLVLDADPGSLVYLGLKEGVDGAAFAEAAKSADVVDVLQRFEVRAGDYIHVPPGTVHAIGKGVTLVEVQQSSDTTFRIYDWERLGLDGERRELHVKEALLSIDYDHAPAGPVRPSGEDVDGGRRTVLADGGHFGAELLDLDGPIGLDTRGVAVCYLVLAGSGTLRLPDREEPFVLQAGGTWLVPASVGAHTMDPGNGEMRVLRIETRE